MFNIGGILKTDITMAVTTQTIKKGGQRWSCVKLVLELVWNLFLSDQIEEEFDSFIL